MLLYFACKISSFFVYKPVVYYLLLTRILIAEEIKLTLVTYQNHDLKMLTINSKNSLDH